MNLKTNYLGLALSSPVIVSSSPFTADIDRIGEVAAAGAGAVVLKSVFEEQIIDESTFLERFNDYPEAADYLRGYIGNEYIAGHLDLIRQAKQSVGIPIIASINCSSAGTWTEYARRIAEAGADALELNIFYIPVSADETAAQTEQRYLDIVEDVTAAVTIPVSVKLGFRFTNILNFALGIYKRKARGVVFFNRFIEPDIDLNSVKMTVSDELSARSEFRNAIRSVAMCAPLLKGLDIAVSTGVHTGQEVVKSLLAGAKAAEVCTAVMKDGPGVIASINEYVTGWMQQHDFNSVTDFTGLLSNTVGAGNQQEFQRAQYVKNFPKG